MNEYVPQAYVYVPLTKERLTPQEYLELIQADAGSIQSVRFIPPKIGSADCGCFEVVYKTPVLRKVTLDGALDLST